MPAGAEGLKDKRGLTLKDDIQQNVMVRETQQRLESLQASATADLKSGDLPGAQLNIATMRQGLAREIELYSAISDYWKNVGWKWQPENAQNTTAALELGAPSPLSVEIETLSAQFDQQIATRDFTTAMRTTWIKLDALQVRVRKEEEQRILASVDASNLQPLRSIGPGRMPCPPAKRTSGSEKPDFRTGAFPQTVDYYPRGLAKASRPANQTVEVFVIVNPEGCPERLFLIKGAERSEFDESALQLAADGRYFPAEKNGVAVRGGLMFRVNF